MIVDIVKITACAGTGGDGCVSFHREKFVQAGGPDGGDGGRGGSIVFVADAGMRTLLDFRLRHKYTAEPGNKGASTRRTGKSGADTVVRVPAGTLIRDAATDAVLADMSQDGQRVVLLHGGRGGWGNARFATPVRQAPNFAKPGQKTEPRELVLELKSIADVGLVGFPNAGKSTLLSIISAARPKIADYPFTTLEPNLGVVRAGEDGFIAADIPGLIEGASDGAGLGHEFLRHVERTRLLLHVVDASGLEGRDPLDDYAIINRELSQYGDLAERPQIVVINKLDIPEAQENYSRLEEAARANGALCFGISAATRQGIEPLLAATMRALRELPPIRMYETQALPEDAPTVPFEVRRKDDVYIAEGPLLTRLIASVNFSDNDSFKWFQRSLRKHGVIDALREHGARDGDTVRIGDLEYDFVD